MFLVTCLFVLSGIIQAYALVYYFHSDNPQKKALKKMANLATLFMVIGIIIFLISAITGLDIEIKC
ncbi:hypothetical protein BKI52_05965 [marine bacterium AO1-C]|nr:hypothetical protein BKI52_05965 [marine bacterium AO1-C]